MILGTSRCQFPPASGVVGLTSDFEFITDLFPLFVQLLDGDCPDQPGVSRRPLTPCLLLKSRVSATLEGRGAAEGSLISTMDLATFVSGVVCSVSTESIRLKTRVMNGQVNGHFLHSKNKLASGLVSKAKA